MIPFYKKNPFTCWSDSIRSHNGQIQCYDKFCDSRYCTGICVFCGEWFCWSHLERHLYTLYITTNGAPGLATEICGRLLSATPTEWEKHYGGIE